MNRGSRSTSENNVPITKRLTRASAKLAAAPEATCAAGGPSRQSLADHKNIQPPPKNAEKKVLMTKQEAKKLATIVEKKREEAPPAREAVRGDTRPEKSLSGSRFDTVVLQCADYADDIVDYMFHVEEKDLRAEDFLHGHEVNSKMRSILVDWLVQVHVRFHLLPETLYGAINLLDRYLSLGHGEKSNLQLVGVTCLSISAKYEEIFPPELQDFVYITENSITKRDIIRMEIKVLSVLKVNLGRPCALQFVRRLTVHFSQELHAVAKYICECAICDYATCHLRPSVIATLAIWLAAILLEHTYPAFFYDIARMSKAEVHAQAPSMARAVLRDQGNSKLIAVRTKYSTLKLMQAAALTAPQLAALEKISKGDAHSMRAMP